VLAIAHSQTLIISFWCTTHLLYYRQLYL